MNNAILLRLHRWLTLIFALPLLVVTVTGLILSFQPALHTHAIKPGSLNLAKLESLIAQHDPQGKACALSIDAFDNILSLDGVGADGSIDIDLATGMESEAETPLSDLFSSTRRIHRQIIFRMGWLVTSSTIAMVLIAALGVLMGWPRLRNTLSGWHKGVAWFTLPLVVLSPVTGLFIAFGINFSNGPAQPRGERPHPLPMIEALRMVAAVRDPSMIVSIGPRGGRLLARVNEGGEVRAYSVTREALTPQPRNWPRLIHEGNWMGAVSSAFNVVTCLAILALLGTGMTIWARRELRQRRRRAALPNVRAGAKVRA